MLVRLRNKGQSHNREENGGMREELQVNKEETGTFTLNCIANTLDLTQQVSESCTLEKIVTVESLLGRG